MPKVGDVVYLVHGLDYISIFEILKIELVTYPYHGSVPEYKFEVCVLSGEWPLPYIYVEEYRFENTDYIIIT